MSAPTVFSFPPLARADATRLILGSMPGQASLEANQYYAHPRNAFWPIMGQLLGFDPALPYAQRCAALQAAGIAVWDVLQSCRRPGSLDADIDPASRVSNDFVRFFAAHPGIRQVFFNGSTAEQLFRRLALPHLHLSPPLHCQRLPSSSPAHAARRPDEKCAAWRVILATAPFPPC